MRTMSTGRDVARTLALLWKLGLPSLRRQPPGPARASGRRDPAPTLWSYRYQRLMLTPGFRRALRMGLPGFAALVAGAMVLGSDAGRARIGGAVEALKDTVQERPEFMIAAMEVEGADPALSAAITEVAGLSFPVSSFDLDLEGLRSDIAELTAVRSARLRVMSGGTLAVEVEQRVPVAVWRYADGLRLIDADGAMTGMIAARSDRTDLPLIAGDGAKDAIGEALALFAAAAPIAPRVRGLVRMGERRWDMVLDSDLRILLPEADPVAALERVIALHQASELLDRDVAVVDMRLGSRPTVRLGPPALAILRNAYAVAATGPSDAPAAPIPEDQ